MIMAFDLIGAMCKRKVTPAIQALNNRCGISSSADASVELQQLTSHDHALHVLITALVTPSASFTLGAAVEPSE